MTGFCLDNLRMRKIFLTLPAVLLAALLMAGPAAASCWTGTGTCLRNSGVFSGSQVWVNTRDSGRAIRADDADTHDQSLADGITNSIAKDGQNSPTQDLPMNAKKHTGVGNASARNHYAVVGQIQDSTYTFVTAASVGGTADAITLAPSPAITAYAAGQAFTFVAEAANTGATTVNVSGQGAKAITKTGNTALTAGDIADTALIQIVYDGTQFQLISTSGVDIGSGILTGNNTFTGTNTFSGTLASTGTFTHDGGTVIPVGTIQMFAGSSEPTGWHFLDGEAISRTTYAACFTVLSTTYGAGDGSTTFNLPDMRGRMALGVGQGLTAEGGGTGTNRTLGATGGKEAHTLTAAQSGLPAHTHLLSGGFGDPIALSNNTPVMGATSVGAQRSGQVIANSAAGASSAHTITPAFLAVNMILFCPAD